MANCSRRRLVSPTSTATCATAFLACTRFDWSQISPAIFGSLFQGVMEARDRRQIGGHYTSERDILKVVRALFLDDLREEFARIKGDKNQLRQFHQKLSRLRFLDPACGCGNFLVITYRELRLLEIEVLKALHGRSQQRLDIQTLSLVDVDAFYGIEISEWPARIAEVAMWLMDHQMNIRLSEAFGQYYVRLPLKKSPTIVCGNALRIDWKGVLPAKEHCDYVLGNPPFVGKKARNAGQQADMEAVFGGNSGTGILDYVCCWYLRRPVYRGHPNSRRVRVDEFDHARRAAGRAVAGSLEARAEDPLCTSHVCLGKRSTREGPRPRRHHRLCRL